MDALQLKVLHGLKVEYRAISDFLVRNSLTNKVSIASNFANLAGSCSIPTFA
jgi:hypothetical protein